jgi:uncharacterized protein YoxC
MIEREKPSRSQRQSTPDILPSTNPLSYPSAEHNWTLQTVFELQKTVGQLTQAVTTLTDQQKEFSKKLDRISHQMYAAIVIILLIGAVLTFFSKGINDVIVHYYLSPTTQQTQPQPQH